MNIIFQINGGIGKCVMATAVCEAIKKKYPDANLIVVSGYADVFLNNPHVHRSYQYGSISYFYDEWIDGKEFKIFAHDPYVETSHVKQNEHLIKTWCEMFDIPYNNEQPKIYLTAREDKFFSTKFTSDRPILLLQTNGGAQTEHKYSWARDIPSSVVVKVIDHFKNDYNIVHIRRDDQLQFDNTFGVSDTFRALCVLISMSTKRLFIDSFAQHVAASLEVPATVCWIANKPEVFGYKIHDNILANPWTAKPELRNSFFGRFNIAGDLVEFPYNNEDDIFDVNKIIKSIER
jgi:ADP-heptose:LPS heptosyltransferase